MTPKMAIPLLPIVLAACAGGPGPAEIADAFWTASRDGDVERAESYVAENTSASMNASADSEIDDFSLGEVDVDGDEATVHTTLSGRNGDRSLEISFGTKLVREDDGWKIDLDGTMGEMVGAVLGTTMGDLASEMGKAMGEAMGEAMKGLAEGMAEGMKALGDSMQSASKR